MAEELVEVEDRYFHELTEIVAEQVGSDDLFLIYDISETVPEKKVKRISIEQLWIVLSNIYENSFNIIPPNYAGQGNPQLNTQHEYNLWLLQNRDSSSPGALSLSANKTNVTVAGGSNGSITATGSGGTAPYQYNINGTAFGASNVFNNLAAATYTLGVKDSAGTIIYIQVAISQPAVVQPPVTPTYDTELNTSTPEGAGASFTPGSGSERLLLNAIPGANASFINTEFVVGGVSSYFTAPGEYNGKPCAFIAANGTRYETTFTDGVRNL